MMNNSDEPPVTVLEMDDFLKMIQGVVELSTSIMPKEQAEKFLAEVTQHTERVRLTIFQKMIKEKELLKEIDYLKSQNDSLQKELRFLKEERGLSPNDPILSKRLEVSVAEFAGALYQTHYFEKYGAAALGLKLHVQPRAWSFEQSSLAPFDIDLNGKLASPVDATLDYPIEGEEDYEERRMREDEEDERRAEEARKLRLLRDQFAMRAPPMPEWFRRALTLPEKPGTSGASIYEGWEFDEIEEFYVSQWPYHWADLMIKARG